MTKKTDIVVAVNLGIFYFLLVEHGEKIKLLILLNYTHCRILKEHTSVVQKHQTLKIIKNLTSIIVIWLIMLRQLVYLILITTLNF